MSEVLTIPVCHLCHGAGQIDSGKNSPSSITCPRCNGTGHPPGYQPHQTYSPEAK